MSIIQPFPPISQSPFPLLQSGVRIAGLLPARVPSSEPPPEQDSPLRFVFDRPSLADLSNQQRDHLFKSANILLEIAIEFMVGAFNEDALRAAEVMFHRGVGGKSAIRPLGPQAFKAENDADWFAMVARAKAVRAMTYAEAEDIVRQARRRGGSA